MKGASHMNVYAPSAAPQPDTVPFLSVKDLTLTYQTSDTLVTATWRISFDVQRGDRFVLLGQSGCGKSSLLKAIGGYMKPTEGSISLQGKQVTRPGPERMFVFQEFDQLLPWKTVIDNIAFPLQSAKGYTPEQAREVARGLIKRVGLESFADAFPHTLSGGMKQRVAIARAFGMEPDVLLMDEPFASLDAMTRRQMQRELLELWREVGVTLIFVTHSVEEALLLGNRLLLLSPHPGAVRAEIEAPGEDFSSMSPDHLQALQGDIERILFEHEPAAEAIQ